jgi:hypothetical protein
LVLSGWARRAAPFATALILLATTAAAPSRRPPMSHRAPAPAAPLTTYEKIIAELDSLSPDPSLVATVHNLRLKRDVATLEFTQGQMALFHAIEGRVWGCVFTGHGTFSFRPPDEIERGQLQRFYSTDSLAFRFDNVVLLFADTTLVELAAELKFAPGTIAKDAKGPVRRSLDLLLDAKSKDVNYSVGKTCLEGASNELFLAFVGQKGSSKGFIFEIDPFQTEQVQLWRPVKATMFQYRIRNREVISQFPMEADRARAAAEPGQAAADAAVAAADTALATGDGDYIASFNEAHYRIRSRFDGGLNLRGDEDVLFRSLENGQNWIALALDPDVDVDSVRWENGTPAEFYKGDGALLLWVRSDHPMASGEDRTLRVVYHGQVVKREDDWVYFDPGSFWYPRVVPGRRATYELEYEHPADYTLVSVGEPSAPQRKGDTVVSQWTVDSPIFQSSFMIGIYKEHVLRPDKIPPVTVLMSEAAHKRVRENAGESLIEEGLAPGKSMDKQVGADIASSLTFYQSIYGPTKLTHFYVAENPLESSFLGIAFPGLIHLDWSTFYNTQAEGSDELLRAHEVAHQWWGALGVAPATYHDRWLSEAFAEFSALCYLQAASKDNKRFLETLRKSRDRIMKNRRFFLGDGQEAGPISLGPRTSTSTTPEDYRLVVYEKGAWVLHMIRNMFLDLDTMKDGGFGDMMREFYSSHAGRDATTADFQRVVERYAGRDMTWFFREWVYGTGIPRYRFAWRSARAEDGKFKVTCRVDQENVPEDFEMFVPIQIDFGGNRYARLRVFVKGPHSEFDLPPLPSEPKAIVFNDLESVLCESKTVDW